MIERKIRKILLIAPPVIVTKDKANFNLNVPMGLAYIAAVLEYASYDVVILDTIAEKYWQTTAIEGNSEIVKIGMNDDEIRNYVIECCPDIVGISSMFTIQSACAYDVAKIVKSINNNIPVIFGGAHPTADPNNVMKNTNIDFVILGEGENSVVQLLNAIETGANYLSIDGIVFKNDDGIIINNPKTRFPDVNSIPFPARHLLPIEKYFETGSRHGASKSGEFRSLSILTSRGCPFRCNFCSAYQMFGRKLRNRDPDSVLREIDELVAIYHVEDLYLTDDQFLANRECATKILDGLIVRNYDLTLDAPNGLSPWVITEDIAIKMKHAGFERAALAIESGNQWVLRNIINKPVQVEQLRKTVGFLRKHGLDVEAFLVVGNVGEKGIESFSQIKDSFELMRSLGIPNNNVSVSFLTPHAGSEAYDVVKKKGYLASDYLDNFYNKPKIATPQWSAKELYEFVAFERFLLAHDNKLLFFPLRIFTNKWRGILLKERYNILSAINSFRKILYRAAKYLAQRGNDVVVDVMKT